MTGMLKRRAKGFTLIELIVVIAIIIILVVVLLIVIQQFFKRGEAEEAKDQIRAIEEAIVKWQEGTGKKNNVYPDSGQNSLGANQRYNGNIKLYEVLITEPDNPFFSGYDLDDVTSEHNGDKVFIDPWGTPLVYFEWASKARAQVDDTNPMGGVQRADPLPKWSRSGQYDIYSAGPDTLFGTEDDIYLTSNYVDAFAEQGDDRPNPFANAK